MLWGKRRYRQLETQPFADRGAWLRRGFGYVCTYNCKALFDCHFELDNGDYTERPRSVQHLAAVTSSSTKYGKIGEKVTNVIS